MNIMNFECHVNTVYRKAHQCMHVYQNLYGGFLCWWLLWEQLFLHSHFFWWFKLLNMKNKNRLKSIVKVCSNISGITLNFLIWDEDFEEGPLTQYWCTPYLRLSRTTSLKPQVCLFPCWLENGCWKLLAVHKWNWRVLWRRTGSVFVVCHFHSFRTSSV